IVSPARPVAPTGPELRQRNAVELAVAQGWAGVALGAGQLQEARGAPHLRGAQRLEVAPEEAVPGCIRGRKLGDQETRDGVAGMSEVEGSLRLLRISSGEQQAVGGNRQ